MSIPTILRKASAWNSDCAPLPTMAIVREPSRARCLAATAEVAAVLSAVRIVISVIRTG